MEYRSEQRVSGTDLPIAKQVWLTLLNDETSEAPLLAANVGNMSGRGVRLLLDRPLELNTAVRVDFQHDHDGALMLGEVVYCVQVGERYAVGLELQHSLVHLSSLRDLMKTLIGPQAPSEQMVKPSKPQEAGVALEIDRN